MKLLGVSISSSIQFVIRALVNVIACHCDPLLKQSHVPMSELRVWTKEGFVEMNSLGWSSFMVKVMGWWAFDVFTLLSGTLVSAAEPAA